jgi:type 1 glutamine amidotransferase
MLKVRFLIAAVIALAVAGLPLATSQAQEKTKNKRLLLVTHSGGFIHNSVGTAEEVLKEIGPKNGFDVTCWRFTEDPDKKVKTKDGKERIALEAYSDRFRNSTKLPVEKENCGRINKGTLKNFDIVLFFTTGNPVTKEELGDLREWVKAGGALAGTHCATDTLYGESVYGDLIGAYFRGHPPGLQKIKVKVEDSKHPAAVGFTDGMDYQDEMYVFRDAPYSREKLHIILSIDAASFSPAKNLTRDDKDYAISWCRMEGKGKVFYTSFGHDQKVWKDEKFQKHLLGGLKWATGELPGDATPSAKPPGRE